MNAITTKPNVIVLHAYEPPSRAFKERLVTAMYSEGKVGAVVLSNGRIYRLPLLGWPVEVAGKPARLREFFSYTSLMVEKGRDGAPLQVRANLALKGGMMRQADILPMYPGYALGSIISRRNLMLPILHQQRNTLDKELELAYSQSENQSERKVDQEESDLMTTVLQQQKENVKSKFKKVCNEITRLYKESEPIAIEETLPIDFNLSNIKTEDRSFPSETMQHLIFSADASGSTESRPTLQKKVERFVAQLFSQDSPSTCISSGQIDGLVCSIENMLKKEYKVSLVGSFITLPKVKVFETIRLRKDYIPGKDLFKNVTEYFVLTEAVLGAVFLGLGRYSSNEVANPRLETESIMTRLAMISFISQGAIPKVSQDAHEVNMWSIYLRWKEALADVKSGYPIGFRVRPLVDIFKENRIEQSKEMSGAIPPHLPPS